MTHIISFDDSQWNIWCWNAILQSVWYPRNHCILLLKSKRQDWLSKKSHICLNNGVLCVACNTHSFTALVPKTQYVNEGKLPDIVKCLLIYREKYPVNGLTPRWHKKHLGQERHAAEWPISACAWEKRRHNWDWTGLHDDHSFLSLIPFQDLSIPSLPTLGHDSSQEDLVPPLFHEPFFC